MTVATNENVTSLYVATFNRAPDAGGLKYWVVDSGLSLEDIAVSFFDQPETQALYAETDSVTFIQAIYNNVLGRDAEGSAGDATTGLGYWVSQLDNGTISRAQMILAIVNGAQGTDRELLENKTEVGLYYVEHNTDSSPNEHQVIEECDATQESVDEIKLWIDGEDFGGVAPSQYNVLDDAKKAYDLDGTSKDDVFVVKKFLSADIHGGDGSDTLDFTKWSETKGVSVNLSTGLGPNGMKVTWVENVRGTASADTLVGNSDSNILVAGGGRGDNIDASVGNDLILFENETDIANAVQINGGQNTDVLRISDDTDITVNEGTFAVVSDIETLEVGYLKEKAGHSATITLVDGPDADSVVGGFNLIGEVKGTTGVDKKGNATDDVIRVRADANATGLIMNLSNTKLTSIEVVENLDSFGRIQLGANTLADVREVHGAKDGTTDLILTKVKTGDIIDLTKTEFTGVDSLTQPISTTTGAAVATTVVVGQSLINSMATNEANIPGFIQIRDGFTNRDHLNGLNDNGNAAAANNVSLNATAPVFDDERAEQLATNWGLSTLRASGVGLDLSALTDGDTNFKNIEFGTAHEVTIGNVNDGDDFLALNSIDNQGRRVDVNGRLIDAQGRLIDAQGNLVDANGNPTNNAVNGNFDGFVDLNNLRTIVGSENDSDLLRVKPNFVHAQNLADVSINAAGQQALKITLVERLDFEETSTVALDNENLTDVRQLSGDDDKNRNAFATKLETYAQQLSTVAENLALQGIGQTNTTALVRGFLPAALQPGGLSNNLDDLIGLINADVNAAFLSGDFTTQAALINISNAWNVFASNLPNTANQELVQANGLFAAASLASLAAQNAVARTIIDAGLETDKGGLDLKGMTIQDIYGLGDNVTHRDGTVTIDTNTKFDTKFVSMDKQVDRNGDGDVRDVGEGSAQTIMAAESGTYEFLSQITEADFSTVTLNNLALTHDVNGDALYDSEDYTVTFGDKFVGFDGNDIVKGAQTGLAYDLGKGDDQFIGSNTANEVVLGGEGNDTIDLMDNVAPLANPQHVNKNNALINDMNGIASPVINFIQESISPIAPSTVPYTGFSRDGLTNKNFDVTGAFADGGAGDDIITSGKGNDVLLGGAGHDSLTGGAGSDILSGGDGDDILSGGKGTDILLGGDGNDVIQGDGDEDYIYGGRGQDNLRGGTLEADGTINYGAQDHFHFAAGDSGTTATTVDAIVDFLSVSRAATLDLTGKDGIPDGIKGGAHDLQEHDVIYLDWYLDNKEPEIDGLRALDVSKLAAANKQETAITSGDAYDTLLVNVDDFFASETTLLAAAEKALDKVYDQYDLGKVLNNLDGDGQDGYTSIAAQFEYGGKEYLVVDAYVNKSGVTVNNFNVASDLLIELSGAKENWALGSNDDGAVEIVVTRWDTVAV